MKDHPIIFSAPMVLALLAGRKTQTRRLAWRTRIEREEGRISGLQIPSAWQRVKPGDRLWVREAHKRSDTRADYKADWHATDLHRFTWQPSIHMPRWASRLTLTVTEVRVQRLQEISEADAMAEGAPCCTTDGEGAFFEDAKRGTHVCGFAGLWNSLHGPDAWAANPEVVALTFTVEQRNIDAALLEVANG
jgi:hypothetical protein